MLEQAPYEYTCISIRTFGWLQNQIESETLERDSGGGESEERREMIDYGVFVASGSGTERMNNNNNGGEGHVAAFMHPL